jgi:uncharacterized protein (DUF2252 family)
MKASETKKKSRKSVTEQKLVSRAEALIEGRNIRNEVPRVKHGEWRSSSDRKPAIKLLQDTMKDFMPNLLPIRYGRMLQSPFSFYRGAAAIMASDLSTTPNSGIDVQCCGDCHLLNFGSFATPERKIIFDVNDFDETFPAPWEWDLKRLATSFVIASLHNGFTENDSSQIVMSCVETYRRRCEQFASMSPLEIWYQKITSEELLEISSNEDAKKRFARNIAKAKDRYEKGEDFPNIMEVVDGKIRIKDQPPLIYHQQQSSDHHFLEMVNRIFDQYIDSLSEEKRVLLRQYRYQDLAAKIVGIGSVGKVCGVLLLLSADNEPLFLQVKEAKQSVLEPFTQKSKHKNDGERVVVGQKLMQSASDMFLGWCEGDKGRQFYIRQLRDMKIKPAVEVYDERSMNSYAKLCGWALARAHSRSGKAAQIAGYIGKSNKFQKAISDFALEYAAQNNEDYEALKEAVSDGTIEAYTE